MEMDISTEPVPQEGQPEIPQLPPPADDQTSMSPEQRRFMIFFGLASLVVIIITIIAIYYLAYVATLAQVTRIRDIFIIFMGLQSILTGLAMVVLLVQVTRLINLLQNEIKPILDSTNETVSTLRGTTAFLTDNLVQPVIKLNEYLAGFTQLLLVIGIGRKTSKK